MKFKLAALTLIALTGQSSALITINTLFAAFNDASNNPVPDGTLWALVVDNSDNVFAGFGIDDSLYQENIANPGVADTYFSTGQTLSLGGNVGGGTIFAMGAINGASALSIDGATSNSLQDLVIGQNGLASGQEFAIYWFPDATYTGNATETIASEVGGLNSTVSDSNFSMLGMIVPADNTNDTFGAVGQAFGGTTSNNDFRAVTLVPEPTSALLAAFGSLALLRRRRVVEVAAE